MAHTNTIILSKGIKLDKNYKQVMSYTESQMLTLLQDASHLVFRNNTYNFNNNTGRINIQASYGTCIQANYMAFQNSEYSNKWFFAFIDNIIMISPSTCEIEYTIDVFATWFDYWNPKECFIIRQHATTDVAGDNTIPEDIEHGEYIANGAEQIYSGFGSYYYVVVTNGGLFSGDNFPVCSIGGLPGTGFYYVTDSIIGLRQLYGLTDSTNNKDIIQCYMIPQNLIPSSAISTIQSTPFIGDLSLGFGSPQRIDWTAIGSRPTSLNGVTPVNKKLLTYPYQFAWWTNSNGSSNISLMGGKFPTLGWSEDAYTNWLTQNSVNHMIGYATIGTQILGGAALMATGGGALAGATMVTSGLTNAATAVKAYYDHSKESDSFKGNINGGDVLSALGANTFVCVPKCIKAEYVHKIDKYFTRYGYRQNAVQYPNMTHRQNYNYIQIASEDNIGYDNMHNGISVPASAMETINNIYRSGVTIWNNHTNFGDYSVSNNIT